MCHYVKQASEFPSNVAEEKELYQYRKAVSVASILIKSHSQPVVACTGYLVCLVIFYFSAQPEVFDMYLSTCLSLTVVTSKEIKFFSVKIWKTLNN